MKRSIGTAMLVIALTGFATLAEAQRAPPHYTVVRLSTLGVCRATDTAGSRITGG